MKLFKRLLKIVGIIILFFVIFSIISVIVAKIYEDDLANYAVKELEKEFQAPMSIGEVSLIPLFSFPHISAEMNQLFIGDPQSSGNDTLFFINSLKLGLNSWDLMAGKQTIDKLEISGLDFEYIVDSSGKSNLDFLIQKFAVPDSEQIEDTSSTSLDFNAEKIKLKDIQINYYDRLNQMGSVLNIPEINIKAKSTQNIFEGKTDGTFIISQSFFKDTKLNQMESCAIDFDLNYENNEAQIKNIHLKTEGLDLQLEGIFKNRESLGINAECVLSTFDLNILKKYLPDEDLRKTEHFTFAKVQPVSLNINADYRDDHIDIENFSFLTEGIEIGAYGSFTNTDTVNIDANIQSLNLNFAVLKNYIPSVFLEEYGIIDLGGLIEISGQINGQYADSVLLPKVEAQAKLQQFSLNTKNYPPIDTLNLSTTIHSNGKTDFSGTSIQFSKGLLRISDSKIEFDGSMVGIENPRYQFNSNLHLNLSDFLSLIPDSLATSVEGTVYASLSTKGILADNLTDDFIDDALNNTSLILELKNVSARLGDTMSFKDFSTHFTYKAVEPDVRQIQIGQLNLKSDVLNINLKNSSLLAIVNGKINHPEHMGIQLNTFNIQNGNIRAFGSGSVNNFEEPNFDFSGKIDLQLNELVPFLPDTLIQDIYGFASLELHSNGLLNFDSIDSQMMKILFENSQFDLTFLNSGLTFADTIMTIENASGRVELQNDVLRIPYFNTVCNGVKMGVDSTIIKNIYHAVLLNQKKELYVHSNIKIGDFIFDRFKHLMDSNENETELSTVQSSSEINSEAPQNWSYLIHGSAQIKSIIVDSFPLDDFTIHKLHVQDMSSLFKLTDSSYIMDQFKFKVFEGETNNSIHYKIREDGTQSVSMRNIVSGMNMRTLLQDMDNFGMDSLITYKNISGLLSTDLNMFIPIEDSVRMDKMMVSGDLTLEKGGVYDYAPAQEMSKFTGIKELDNIQFKTLRSSIFMFKNKLYVPRTDIVSNALDIAAFGMQSLDGDSEYHLEIHLSNILFGKSKNRNKKQNESGDEIDKESLKKSSRKIRYSVIDGKSKVGLDSKESRDDMMNKIRTQNKMLDFIFFPKNIHYNTLPE